MPAPQRVVNVVMLVGRDVVVRSGLSQRGERASLGRSAPSPGRDQGERPLVVMSWQWGPVIDERVCYRAPFYRGWDMT